MVAEFKEEYPVQGNVPCHFEFKRTMSQELRLGEFVRKMKYLGVPDDAELVFYENSIDEYVLAVFWNRPETDAEYFDRVGGYERRKREHEAMVARIDEENRLKHIQEKETRENMERDKLRELIKKYGIPDDLK